MFSKLKHIYGLQACRGNTQKNNQQHNNSLTQKPNCYKETIKRQNIEFKIY